MFQQDFKNNLKDKIIYNKKILNDIFNLIEVIIDFNNKLYKKVIKKIQLISKKSKNLFWINN